MTFDRAARGHLAAMTTSNDSKLEPIGDPDDETGDFAGEHENFTADKHGTDPEPESPDEYAGGLDREGPP